MNPFDVLIKRRVHDVDGDGGMSKSASHDKVLSSLSKSSDPDLYVSHKKRQGALVEIKKVFHDLDLPWTAEDFTSLSTPELECELEKALPLLQDEDLLKEVEETRQAQPENVDDPGFGAVKERTLPPPNPYRLTETINTPLDELEELVPAGFKTRLAGLEVSPDTMRNCFRLYLDGQEAMAVKYLSNRAEGSESMRSL